jgi:protein-disulfide isomerase
MRRNQISTVARPRLSEPVCERDHRQGSDRASLTLLEYGDYECPYCGEAHPVVQGLQKAFGRDLRFVFRNFPLTDIHPNAMLAAEAVEAAALQGKFWPMHDLALAEQALLEPNIIPVWAAQVGLDLETFRTDLRRGTAARRVKEDLESGLRSGVDGTPAFFIDGQRYIGVPSYEALREALRGTTPSR